jgi:hypothetical protein
MLTFLRNRPLALFVMLLLAFEALAAEPISSNSVVIDEFAHLPAGVAYWRDSLFSMYDENPPLARYLIALPAYLSGATMDYSKAGLVRRWEWDVARDFLLANRNKYIAMFIWGRFVVTALSVACGAIIFLWSAPDNGPAAGLVCAALWFSDPNVIAHSTMATTDIATTTVGCLATFLFWRFLHQPSGTRAVWSGVTLGVALGTKFSMLVLLPAWAAMAFTIARPNDTTAVPTAPMRIVFPITAIAIPALLVINLLYGFQGTPSVLGTLPFISPLLSGNAAPGPGQALAGNRFSGTWLGGLVIPLPNDYLVGFDSMLFDQQVGDFANLSAGRLVRGGFWYSPLRTFIFKTPLGTLLLLGAAGAYFACNIRRIRRSQCAVWIFPLALIGALCIQRGGLNFAYRYAMPALPFLLIGVGPFVHAMLGNRSGRAFIIGCLVWNGISVIGVRPSYLCFGNELVGGPRGAQREFLGSNYDWGQDLFRLKRWADQHPGAQPLAVAYYGEIVPGEVGLRTRRPPRCLFQNSGQSTVESQDGFYWAISSNVLHGLPGRIVDDTGFGPPGIVRSAHLTPEKAVARVGYSIYIFQVGPTRNLPSRPDHLTVDMLAGCIKGLEYTDLTATP